MSNESRDLGLRGKDLAYALLDFIKANPKEWNQAYWLCDTAGCIAGLACVFSGYERSRVDAVLAYDEQTRESFTLFRRVNKIDDPMGQTYLIRDKAAELLGITEDQANHLFFSINSLEDLRSYILEFYGSREVETRLRKFLAMDGPYTDEEPDA